MGRRGDVVTGDWETEVCRQIVFKPCKGEIFVAGRPLPKTGAGAEIFKIIEN
jgi:hypothetical protein